MSEKCRNKHNNNNSDNPLISRRTDGGKKVTFSSPFQIGLFLPNCVRTHVLLLKTLSIFDLNPFSDVSSYLPIYVATAGRLNTFWYVYGIVYAMHHALGSICTG